ncbi:MAG: porin, partial [Proteobacteria bacterium SW_6_67_9]
ALSEALESQAGSGGGSDTSVNGYGEIHYNDKDPDASGKEGTERVDFHRFILEIGHEFTDDIRFYSELEFEHAVLEPEDESVGELKLEQGYVEFDLNRDHRVQAGLFLMPVGIINESHEPPTFYGVERNQVESNLLPSTWAETGGLLKGSVAGTGLSYDVGIHTGLNSPDGVIEEGVELAAKQPADSFAATGRLTYTGVSGLELAASASLQDDLSQGDETKPADSATLATGHARYNIGGLQLTALAAGWSVDGDVADAAEDQTGGYLEAAYKPVDSVGVFVRQANEDIYDGGDVDRDTTTVGVNYWPHPDVVLKLDAQQQDADNDGNATDSVNAGIGWQF